MRSDPAIDAETFDEHVSRSIQKIRDRFRPRPQLQFRPSSAALLIVDMNCFFADPKGRRFVPMSVPVTERIARLASCFRSGNRPVFYTRHGHEGPHDTGMIGRFFTRFIEMDSPEAQIIPPLRPEPGDRVVDKKTYDAFWNTPLEEMLRSEGVEQLLITGVLTQMCVETTARSAFCRGFAVHIAADATATTHADLHLASLLGLASAVAIIHTADEIVSSWP